MFMIHPEMATPTDAKNSSMAALEIHDNATVPMNRQQAPCSPAQRVGWKHIQSGLAMGLVGPTHNHGTISEDGPHVDNTQTSTHQMHLHGLRCPTAVAHQLRPWALTTCDPINWLHANIPNSSVTNLQCTTPGTPPNLDLCRSTWMLSTPQTSGHPHYGTESAQWHRLMPSTWPSMLTDELSSAAMLAWMRPKTAAVHGQSMVIPHFGKAKESYLATAMTPTQADQRPSAF